MKDRVKKIIGNLDIGLAGAALVILILLTFTNAVMRRFFNNPIQWTEEVQKACFIWIVYFGSGAVFRNGGHVAIDIVVDLFPKKVQRVIELVGVLITVYVLGNLFLQSFELVGQFYRTARVTNLLKIPYYMIYGAVPAGCLTMIASVIWTEWRKLKEAGKEEKE